MLTGPVALIAPREVFPPAPPVPFWLAPPFVPAPPPPAVVAPSPEALAASVEQLPPPTDQRDDRTALGHRRTLELDIAGDIVGGLPRRRHPADRRSGYQRCRTGFQCSGADCGRTRLQRDRYRRDLPDEPVAATGAAGPQRGLASHRAGFCTRVVEQSIQRPCCGKRRRHQFAGTPSPVASALAQR